MIEQATVSLTPQALDQLKSLLSAENNPALGLRVFVSGGGCSGLQYGMAFDDQVPAEAGPLSFPGGLAVIKAVFLDVGGVFHLPTEERLRGALRGAGFELPEGVLTRAHYAGMTGHDRFDGDYREVMKPYVEEMARELAVPETQVDAARTALLEALTTPGAWADHLQESVEEL